MRTRLAHPLELQEPRPRDPARRPGVVPALALLYFTYGLARAIDLLGLHPRKPSWKAPARSTRA